MALISRWDLWVKLRPHRKIPLDLINNRGGIVDHIVGAEWITQCRVPSRRMGIAKKPMIIALGTVAQIAKKS